MTRTNVSTCSDSPATLAPCLQREYRGCTVTTLGQMVAGDATAPLHRAPCDAQYEMDFADAYNKLFSLGATFNRDSYLHPQPILG